MKKYEGLISKELEEYLNMTEGLTYEELIEFDKTHPNILTENVNGYREINMSLEELCEKYDLVDVSSFFVSHGVKLQDLL